MVPGKKTVTVDIKKMEKKSRVVRVKSILTVVLFVIFENIGSFKVVH